MYIFGKYSKKNRFARNFYFFLFFEQENIFVGRLHSVLFAGIFLESLYVYRQSTYIRLVLFDHFFVFRILTSQSRIFRHQSPHSHEVVVVEKQHPNQKQQHYGYYTVLTQYEIFSVNQYVIETFHSIINTIVCKAQTAKALL